MTTWYAYATIQVDPNSFTIDTENPFSGTFTINFMLWEASGNANHDMAASHTVAFNAHDDWMSIHDKAAQTLINAATPNDIEVRFFDAPGVWRTGMNRVATIN